MTSLRQRMIEDLQLRGLSARTQEAYVAAIRQLAEHYGKSPNQISDEELRQYFLYLTNDLRSLECQRVTWQLAPAKSTSTTSRI
jgi:hypothetical protein